MKYIVEFIGHDGKVRKTQAFNSKESAELACICIPSILQGDIETRIVPESEYITEDSCHQSKN